MRIMLIPDDDDEQASLIEVRAPATAVLLATLQSWNLSAKAELLHTGEVEQLLFHLRHPARQPRSLGR